MMDVCKSAGRRNRRVEILKDVSLSVSAREIVGIVEEQPGAGTMLLYVAAGRIRPDAGQIWLGDTSLARLSRLKRNALCRRHVQWVGDLKLPHDMNWTVQFYLSISAMVSSSYRGGIREEEAGRMAQHDSSA